MREHFYSPAVSTPFIEKEAGTGFNVVFVNGSRTAIGAYGETLQSTPVVDLMLFDGLHEIFCGYHIGIKAENIAEKYGISRMGNRMNSAHSATSGPSQPLPGDCLKMRLRRY